jgi:hypothetical protein
MNEAVDRIGVERDQLADRFPVAIEDGVAKRRVRCALATLPGRPAWPASRGAP